MTLKPVLLTFCTQHCSLLTNRYLSYYNYANRHSSPQTQIQTNERTNKRTNIFSNTHSKLTIDRFSSIEKEIFITNALSFISFLKAVIALYCEFNSQFLKYSRNRSLAFGLKIEKK